MKTISVEVMRGCEQKAIARGVSGFEMMRAAAASALPVVLREARLRHARRLVILAGKGNNAGDGFTLARLAEPAMPVLIYSPFPVSALTGDAAKHARLLPPSVPVVVAEKCPAFEPGDLIVDALLGTGFHGTVHSPIAGYILAANAAGLPIVAMDLPSGLNADTGEAETAIRAVRTVTFGMPKAGLFLGRGPELAGPVACGAIGLPADIESGAPWLFEATFASDIAPLFPPLAFDDYKNSRGRLLIAAGSHRYPGAPVLAVRAAMRAGAGFVRLAAVTLPFAPLPASLVLHHLPADDGCFGRAAAAQIREILPQLDAIAAGPGCGQGREITAFFKELIAAGKPLLLDADALNWLAQFPETALPEQTILTPHRGEAARLFAAKEESIPDDRFAAACRLAALYGAVVVWKGPQTVVAAPDGRFAVNSSGSPALGVAGSGDVLAGTAGAFLAQGMPAWEAARAAVFLHGAAGESVPRRGLVADDLPERIREAIAEIQPLA